MKSFTIIFGGTKEKPRQYSVLLKQTPASWRQQADGSTFCMDCGETLTLCFLPRIVPAKGNQGSDYMQPCGVRCDCFLDGPQPELLPYHRKLKTEPLPIILVEPEPVA